MSNKPFILSNKSEDKKEFEAMINKTMASFFRTIDDESAFSGINPYVLRKEINDLGFLPEKGIGFDETMKKVEETILPNLLRTWSTSYMPHLHSPALLETIASELLIAAFNDSMDSWDQGPAATEVEEAMIHGLLNLYGYKEGADGCFTSGGSQSNISAIIAARDWYLGENFGLDVKKRGIDGRPLTLYTSEISHFSMDKGCHILGLGYDAVRKIPVDDRCKVDINAFKAMVEEDVDNGFYPFAAVATIGTTDFGSIDDVKAMREICDKYGMHLHADAAYGSGAIMSSKYRERIGDLSLADSITIDFHKMFLLPISCSALLMKNGKKLECFELHADYLNREEDEEDGYTNLVDKSLQTTRRFDALKVWMSFLARGKDGWSDIITKVMDNARYFYSVVSANRNFFVVTEPEISSVVFRVVNESKTPEENDEMNKKIRRTLLHKLGIVVGQTVSDHRVCLKFTLLNPDMSREKLDSLVKTIEELGRAL